MVATMNEGDFAQLCIKTSEDRGMYLFGDFDAQCLVCGRRIGSHSQLEFKRCASMYRVKE